MIERVVEFLRPYFADWGYVLVGTAGFLENSIGAGLILPGETIVILGGFYAASGDLSFVAVATIAAVAGALGDNVGYLIGNRFGRRVLDRFGRFLFLSPARVARAEDFYRRHGGKTVFLGRFIPVVRSLGCLIAGMSRLSYRRFVVYDLLGATIWAVGNTFVGYLIGRGYERVERYLGGAGVAALLLLIVLVWLSAWWSRRRRRAEEGLNVGGPGADTSGEPEEGHHDAHR
ncbi:MAG TPA: DedA family protein [Actinomycetota bacterium]|nr:DedA family protein [Actinomycetota bacterium]